MNYISIKNAFSKTHSSPEVHSDPICPWKTSSPPLLSKNWAHQGQIPSSASLHLQPYPWVHIVPSQLQEKALIIPKQCDHPHIYLCLKPIPPSLSGNHSPLSNSPALLLGPSSHYANTYNQGSPSYKKLMNLQTHKDPPCACLPSKFPVFLKDTQMWSPHLPPPPHSHSPQPHSTQQLPPTLHQDCSHKDPEPNRQPVGPFRLHPTLFYSALDTIDHPAPSEISFPPFSILTFLMLINIIGHRLSTC